MSKATQYQCDACGHAFNKWSGQCPECNAWNTLEETRSIQTSGKVRSIKPKASNRVIPLAEVDTVTDPRIQTNLGELDRVLGGGIVHGSVVLVGGSPGIGKSTLLIQMLASLNQYQTLYISGEESAQQISLRAERLDLNKDNIRLLSSVSLEEVLSTLQATKPKLVIVDSIQTLASEQLNSAAGSVSQVRECAGQLVQFAKNSSTTLFVVGHVTKEGTLAGPRVLEHMVDTVLYFEGDSSDRFRLLRATKNRFGAVNELGVFVMQETGLKGVKNPSALFLSHHQTPAAGSIVMVTREGTRPLMVEVQSLVDDNPSSNPRRLAQGIEQNRLSMLLAVMNRHGGISLHNDDVFINVVGGVRVQEPAVDLPILLATLSSFRDFILPRELVAFGEVGLAGEIRPVPNGQERLREASKHGFKHAIIPTANAPKDSIEGLEIIPVSRLSEAIDWVLNNYAR
ncbi:MAG: DNA repair protein RadA [Gammaproteobacteria bacterium]